MNCSSHPIIARRPRLQPGRGSPVREELPGRFAIEHLLDHPRATFIEGSITDLDLLVETWWPGRPERWEDLLPVHSSAQSSLREEAVPEYHPNQIPVPVYDRKVVLKHPVDFVQVQPAVEVDQNIPKAREV